MADLSVAVGATLPERANVTGVARGDMMTKCRRKKVENEVGKGAREGAGEAASKEGRSF